MFARSLMSRSVASALAAILAITVMPNIAGAQERPERDARVERFRAERQGMPAGQPQQRVQQQMPRIDTPRAAEVQRQVYQGQAYQQQRPQGLDNRQGWGGGDRGRGFQNDRVQAPVQAQAQAQVPVQTGGPVRTADRGQWGRQGQDRGDRGNWQSRNPSYADGNRNPAYQPQVQQNRGVNPNRGADNDRRGDRGLDRGTQWSRNDQNRWGRGDQRGWDQRGWDQRGWQDRRGDWDRNRGWNGNRGGTYYGNRYGFAGNNGFRAWDNGWRRDRRYDWYSYRNSNRNFFRGGFYSAPFRGYSYSRLSVGIFLGSAFYDQRYWINNPWDYRLPNAYGPYRWVRYYDDALLVDIYSGEVVDAIYDFYW